MRFFKITNVVPFESAEVFHQDPFLALYFSLSSLMIFRSLCLLPSAALITLKIWPIDPPPPRSPLRWSPHKQLCFDWSAGLRTGVFLSIRANVRPLSSQWIPTKLTSSPTSSYSASRLRFNPTPTFLGVTFDRTLSFAKHVSLLKAKFFPRLKALRCISASSWGPSKESLSLLLNLFSGPFSLTLHPDGFLSYVLPISPNWNASTERPVAPSPDASRPSLSLFFSPRLLYLPYESP